MTRLTTINSIVKTGKIGGAIGGILVKSHEITGDKKAINNTYLQDKNILPTITGRNIGKNADPRPNK